MKTLGTAFAILVGGVMITGMYAAGLISGVALAIKMEEKDGSKPKKCSYRDYYNEKRKEDNHEKESES